ncbi:hypothetical protein ACFY0F_16915 [Streptomyces sp. NPDC001544]|uniref:transmembrane-type terpene cyclase n=1 Tax=Streptomyces sp. NPDC001544 TaxID=3364584 RepID=UPI00368CEB95
MRALHTAFLLGTGVFWAAAYVLIIRAGMRERTFGMPVVAFATNMSWEFMFAFVRPQAGVMQVVNIVWFCFDLAIAYTVVRFGRTEFPYLPERLFLPALGAVLLLAYPGMNFASEQFDHGEGGITAFGSNVAMSAMFLGMLAARRGLRGQSPGIALTKLVGTACASLTLLTDPDAVPRHETALMHYFYVACLVLDAAYVYAVYAVRRHDAQRRHADEAGRAGTATTPGTGLPVHGLDG